MPSLGEYLGGSLQRASERIVPYWLERQQMERQGEQDAYRKERDQVGDTRIADALAQQKEEFEYTRNRNRQQDFLGMMRQLEQDRQAAQPQPEKLPTSLDGYAVWKAERGGDDSMLKQLLAAKTDKGEGGSGGGRKMGDLTPYQFYTNLQSTFKDASGRGQTGILNQADELASSFGMLDDDGGPFTVGDRADLVGAVGQRGETFRPLLKQFDYTGGPEHEAAFMSSPDSLYKHNPALGRMAGIPEPQPQSQQQSRRRLDIGGILGRGSSYGSMQAPPPPPNDGSFSDEEYQAFVSQWYNNPDWWSQ